MTLTKKELEHIGDKCPSRENVIAVIKDINYFIFLVVVITDRIQYVNERALYMCYI